MSSPTTAFSCGARSAFKLRRKRLLEKHAIAPSAARLCCAARCQEIRYFMKTLKFQSFTAIVF
jgi:hypothetical protein